ncbi:integrase core domain-containing protein [Nocardia carnea]|uniref:integrase core domain-containing protein n=1 Tax=Nocardia carnea TaxID=37328 RepID=UPI003D7A8B9E
MQSSESGVGNPRNPNCARLWGSAQASNRLGCSASGSQTADRVGISYILPGTPWNKGYIESFNRRLRAKCLNRNH